MFDVDTCGANSGKCSQVKKMKTFSKAVKIVVYVYKNGGCLRAALHITSKNVNKIDEKMMRCH